MIRKSTSCKNCKITKLYLEFSFKLRFTSNLKIVLGPTFVYCGLESFQIVSLDYKGCYKTILAGLEYLQVVKTGNLRIHTLSFPLNNISTQILS